MRLSDVPLVTCNSCKEEFWSETCGGIEDNACGECEDGCAGRHHLVAPRCPLHSGTAQCAGTTVPPYLVSTGQEGLISQRSGANLQERGERGGGRGSHWEERAGVGHF